MQTNRVLCAPLAVVGHAREWQLCNPFRAGGLSLILNGVIRPKQLAYLAGLIHRYEAAVATACKAVASCRYDAGAFGRAVDGPGRRRGRKLRVGARAFVV